MGEGRRFQQFPPYGVMDMKGNGKEELVMSVRE